MMKKAFVFPGQGAQKVGMVKDLYDAYPVVKQLFEEADDALGFSLTKLCFEGPDEELMKTYNTQPAILTASTACCRVLAQEGLTPDIAAGHSLGEYSALVAAGALTFADAVRTVRLRGQFMQEAVPLGEGGMAAILGLAEDKIKEICAQVSAQGGTVQAVNFNCPGQIVIAGSTKAVEEAAAAMKEAGAKRAILLHVSAPFHSTLMEPAAKRLAEVLDDITISDAKIPALPTSTARSKHRLPISRPTWSNRLPARSSGSTARKPCRPLAPKPSSKSVRARLCAGSTGKSTAKSTAKM